MACSYCYVPRRKGFANPITVFANIEAILGYIERHVGRQGVKPAPNQCDPVDWVYDIGENSDCSADALVSDNVRDLVDLFARLPPMGAPQSEVGFHDATIASALIDLQTGQPAKARQELEAIASGLGEATSGYAWSALALARAAEGDTAGAANSLQSTAIDPKLDTQVTYSLYAVIPSPVDDSVWGVSEQYPGFLVRLQRGDNPPSSCKSQ